MLPKVVWKLRLTVETIEADSVQSTDDKQKLDKLFEEIKNKAISGIMLYEIAPMEDIPLMFRNYDLADLINFIDANKTSPMDMNTMLALDKAIRIYKAHMNNIGMYLWGLGDVEGYCRYQPDVEGRAYLRQPDNTTFYR